MRREEREIFLIIDIHGNLFIFQSNDCSFHSQNKTKQEQEFFDKMGMIIAWPLDSRVNKVIYFWLKVLRVAMTDLISGLILGLLSQHCLMSLQMAKDEQ